MGRVFIPVLSCSGWCTGIIVAETLARVRAAMVSLGRGLDSSGNWSVSGTEGKGGERNELLQGEGEYYQAQEGARVVMGQGWK